MDDETLSQSLARRLLRVALISDIHERAADLGFAIPSGPRRRLRLARIAERQILFIHVPKTGGTSVSRSIYGLHIGHATFRYYECAAPRAARTMPSFAILRDPISRFLSAFRHARHGSAADSAICPAYREHYRAFRSLDDALDHVERARGPYGTDPIFRPQWWFLLDRRGRLGVQRLYRFEDLKTGETPLPHVEGAIPHLNRSHKLEIAVSPEQDLRIRALYARDYGLLETLPGAGGSHAIKQPPRDGEAPGRPTPP